MPGRGPLPKVASHRSQRRRTAGGEITLVAEAAPFIPAMPEGQWHPASKRWWTGVWANPVTQTWVEHDQAIVEGALLLVERLNRLDLDDPATARTAVSLSAEIRLQEARLALGPGERLRHRVRVVRAEEAEAEAEQKARRVVEREAETAAIGDVRDLLLS